MRIHHLRFGALGPFLGEADIDFEALSEHGLFLIEGPTGSGKSTIIDAIAFALYGETAGSATSSSSDRLVSDFRPTDSSAVPYAELTFETAGRFWRVRRAPRHLRAKQRGGGTTPQPAQAFLYELTRAQVHQQTDGLPLAPVSASPQETGPLVQDLIGLTARQFAQTVVLPQGEFATFLRAKTVDRQVLLEKLFATSLYSDIGKVLGQRATAVQDSLAAADAEVGGGVRRFVEAAGLSEAEEEVLLALAQRATDLIAALELHRDELLIRADTLHSAQVEAASRLVNARAEHEQVRELHRRVGLRREADQRQASLEQASAAIDQARVTVADLARAAVPGERLRALRESEVQFQSAAQGLESALSEASELRALTADQCDEQRTALERRLVELGPLAESERELPRRQLELADAKERHIELLRSLAATNEALEAIPPRRTELNNERQVLAARAESAPLLAEQYDNLRARLEAAVEAEAVAATVHTAETAVATADRECREAEVDETRLARLHRASAAVMLSSLLVEGEPCQVCGSIEHPAVAVADGELTVDLDMVEAATATTAAARARHAAAVTELSRVEQQRALAVARANGDAEMLRAQTATAKSALDGARTAGEQVAHVTAQLAALEVERAALDLARSELQHADAEAKAGIAASEGLIEHERRDIAVARGERESIASVVLALGQTIAHLTSVATAQRDSARAHAAVTRCTTALSEALNQYRFADAAAVELALSWVDERTRLESEIEAHHEATVRVRHTLDELHDVDPTTDVVLEPTDLRLAEAERQHVASVAAHGLARNAADSATSHCATVSHRLDSIARQRDEARTLLNLAQLVNGGVQNISLSLFAVSRRFHDVVEVANQRLAPMLGGRLTLEAHDDQLDGRSRFGLGLRVIDNFSGTARQTTTLSGGESFCCALALALGLAEVVMQASGALTIDTLFIDEGFGSLDPTTLDDVTVELDRLREGGRMVGLVSHVTEMKSQIHRQIRVTRIEGSHSNLEVLLP